MKYRLFAKKTWCRRWTTRAWCLPLTEPRVLRQLAHWMVKAWDYPSNDRNYWMEVHDVR